MTADKSPAQMSNAELAHEVDEVARLIVWSRDRGREVLMEAARRLRVKRTPAVKIEAFPSSQWCLDCDGNGWDASRGEHCKTCEGTGKRPRASKERT